MTTKVMESQRSKLVIISTSALSSILCGEQSGPDHRQQKRRTSKFYADFDEKVWEELEQELELSLPNPSKTFSKG